MDCQFLSKYKVILNMYYQNSVEGSIIRSTDLDFAPICNRTLNLTVIYLPCMLLIYIGFLRAMTSFNTLVTSSNLAQPTTS